MSQEPFKSAPVDCQKCELHVNRTQIVYPDVFTNSKDKITTLVIGEAPGASEDKQGKPFVGASGKILRRELQLLPGKIIITNTVKCRPPENRNPQSAEKKACYEFLEQELTFYDPDFIILVGRVSSSLYIDAKTLKNFTSLSGSLVQDKFIPVLHPASTMYNAKKNKPIWEESWNEIRKHIYSRYPDAAIITSSEEQKSRGGKKISSLDQFIATKD